MNKSEKPKIILHIDMNSFYASVEAAHNPDLRGKPLAIAGNVEERRGIIVTCSYEARAKGVKATMPLWQAKKLCPNLFVMPPNHAKYRRMADRMFELLRSYTPLVEPVSIDEGYVDITDVEVNGSYLAFVKTIQQNILSTLNLPSSIGIAPNKFLAKMASDMKKPMGITILRKRDVPKVLWPLQVGEMHGIGKKSAEKLNKIKIYTIKDLAHADSITLEKAIGINGIRLKERANGIDNRPVDPEAANEWKSIGNSTTLRADTVNMTTIQNTIKRLSESVARRMQRKKVVASTIQLTIRYGKNRKTITRSMTEENAVEHMEELYERALFLFEKNWSGDPIRLIGVAVQNVIDKKETFKQLDLFSSNKKDEKKTKFHETLSNLQQKFGQDIVFKGKKDLE
ncbi:DNA polymerase IV [Lottiidibacillus patelloidae]|uniref:DNA polymerase IV n=1 Tax=Lottiidibacillus patelloidae TaxID=2670334 RepID=A0A263BV21_9BACI|nr:DNA polymerase IV [Lottiidibacillus patelloidae]OZM57569.1 DNA polymerase IV [Lottiidibacillus patelloidae]